MKCSRLVGPACLFVALGAVGCSQSSDSKPAADAEGTAAVSVAKHVHGTGPNGGVVFDFGGRHAEFTVDHGKHEVTVLVLGDDEKTPTAVTADELMLNILETKTADGTVVSPMTTPVP